MAGSLFESEYLYGLQDPGGESLMLDAECPGWLLFREELGHDPYDESSRDFTPYSERGLGVLCLLTHGREPHGTLPHSSLYESFAQRVAKYVANSSGCKIWIIGHEMNYAVERPGVNVDWSRHPSVHGATPEDSDPLRHGLPIRFNVLPDYSTEIRTTRGAMVSPGEVITPAMYARCYRLCRDAIHRVPGHEDDQVIVGGVTPWNTQSIYPGNANGDWVLYFRDILNELGPTHCDGFCIHTFTHGADPGFITSEELLPAPFQGYHQHFRAYRDFLAVVPDAMRHLPVYISETDQTEPWLDRNVGWIQTAYTEIAEWNSQPENQQIRALILYRWSKSDRWFLQGRSGILEDFRDALTRAYRWQGEPEAVSLPEPANEESAPGPAEAKLPDRLVEWVGCTVPRRMIAGQAAMIQLTLRNQGGEAWMPTSDATYGVRYAYYRNRRRLEFGTENDIAGTISSTVAHGDIARVDVRIRLPDQPGNYTLEFDLVTPAGGSFKEEGAPVLTRWVTVEAPSRLPVDGTNGDNSTLPVPLFSDLSNVLPRASIPYAHRELKQVRYIVLSHTAANPRVSLERIAQTHIRYGYPGIAYDFVVDGMGQVFKVSELQEVAQPNQVWSEQGVNVCLVGNFNEGSPPMAQLDATGRLCAWLAQNLGLTPDAILGLGELTRTDSPGRSFYKGPSWKDVLSRQVRLHLAAISSAGDGGRVLELNQAIEELRVRNQRLNEQLEGVNQFRQRLDDEKERLTAEIGRLRDELDGQRVEFVGGVRVQRKYDQMLRDADRYQIRHPEDVHSIVIHHTGVHPDTGLEELARIHQPDWPGVLFDYLIMPGGEIFQTQPLEEVVDAHEEYLARAIGVAFAGNFDEDVPTDQQLHSGGLLIAWLLETFPNVSAEAVHGVSEFIEHNSPGRAWLAGARWKHQLLSAIQAAQGSVTTNLLEQKLRSEIAEVENRLVAVQDSLYSVEDQRSKLEHENLRLQTQLRERQDAPAVYVVPQPAMRVAVEQLPRHPTLRYDHRSTSQISHIAIHHTATPATMGPDRIAELHVAADPSRGKDAWPGIGYHFFVHSDGVIDQTNYLESASFHVFRHNVYSVGIVFAGSFMNGRIPTSAQLRSGAHLVAWLMQELNIPLARVWGHREFPDNSTVCPGSEWTLGNRWRDLLFERIEQVQSGIGVKSIRHYMLFWQRPFPGPLARQDFVNAINYVVRFRPSVGFSLQDAKNAEYVTIVGGEAGISANDEQMLRDSGCRVERIAGRNEEETSRILSEMASQGRRFRSTDVDF